MSNKIFLRSCGEMIYMKRFIALLLTFLLVLCVSGCSCKHEFEEATCTLPKMCKHCKATEEEALGHKWKNATLASPKTCKVCEATEGTNLFYQCRSWNEVFQLSFEDEFDFPIPENDQYKLSFPKAASLKDFMIDTLTTCMLIGVHCNMCKASSVSFVLENECMIICFVPKSASIPHTLLIVLDGASEGTKIQSLYDTYFGTMRMDMKAELENKMEQLK